MYNLYAGLVGRKCECVRPSAFETEEKGVTDDTRIYTYESAASTYKLFKLMDLSEFEDGFVTGQEIKTQKWQPLHGCPDFGKVGIFRVRGYKDQPSVRLPLEAIKGKVCIVENFAVTLPNIILNEAS